MYTFLSPGIGLRSKFDQLTSYLGMLDLVIKFKVHPWICSVQNLDIRTCGSDERMHC